MSKTETPLRAWRKRQGLTLEQAAASFGLKSKGQLSEIENGGGASVPVALSIEEVTGGEIAASSLSRDVALVEQARAA